MHTILFSWPFQFDTIEPYVQMLRTAGLALRTPQSDRFGRGEMNEEETIGELQGVSAVIAWAETYTSKVIAAAPDLQVIARAGVGYDKVNIESATDHDIVVTITPSANFESVAEHTFALLLAVARSIAHYDRRTRAGQWQFRTVLPLRGRVLGLIGLGRIGRSVALRASAFGMKILAFEPQPDLPFVRRHGIELLDLPSLLARSDFVSLHCPLNDETRGMINRDVLAQMKGGAVIVNASRGGLIVEKDLAASIESGHLAGAGLDVFEHEPAEPGNPLFKLDNVVVSPHVAGCDSQSAHDMAAEAAQNILCLARGEWPESAVVNAELKPRWRWGG